LPHFIQRSPRRILTIMESNDVAENPALVGMTRLAFSMSEGAALLGLSRSTLYRLTAAGKFRTVVHGRRRLIPAGELDRLLSTSLPVSETATSGSSKIQSGNRMRHEG
jgi:excisionase family DNA binding protein